MRIAVGSCWLELCQGDITHQAVDLIVNAANSQLAGGGGVDGAIHRRGGPTIMAETDRHYPQGCPTGSAVNSSAGNLPARFVAHAVGPIWRGGDVGEAGLLAGAVRRSLELAVENDCRSVAMPAISAGVYGYPLAEAARVSLQTAMAFLDENQRPELVRFVLFGPEALTIFTETLLRLLGGTECNDG
jgi:O-acetyl-ADP-ribose deacetylase (regulator of RNase III)